MAGSVPGDAPARYSRSTGRWPGSVRSAPAPGTAAAPAGGRAPVSGDAPAQVQPQHRQVARLQFQVMRQLQVQPQHRQVAGLGFR